MGLLVLLESPGGTGGQDREAPSEGQCWQSCAC